MNMHNPAHPGEIIREFCLIPLDLSITSAARAMKISRKTLSSILNGRSGVSPEMSIRLSLAFGGSPESWLTLQMQYDLWHAKQNLKKIKVRRFIQQNEFFLEH